MPHVRPSWMIAVKIIHFQQAIAKCLGLSSLPPEVAIVATPPNTFEPQKWHMDGECAHKLNNAVIIPLTDEHDHTEFLNAVTYKYRARKPFENYKIFGDSISWPKNCDKDLHPISVPSRQLTVPEFILFNTMCVHRGPSNLKSTWRIVLFMTWAVGIDAAIKRKDKLELAEKDKVDSAASKTSQKRQKMMSDSSVVTWKNHQDHMSLAKKELKW